MDSGCWTVPCHFWHLPTSRTDLNLEMGDTNVSYPWLIQTGWLECIIIPSGPRLWIFFFPSIIFFFSSFKALICWVESHHVRWFVGNFGRWPGSYIEYIKYMHIVCPRIEQPPKTQSFTSFSPLEEQSLDVPPSVFWQTHIYDNI